MAIFNHLCNFEITLRLLFLYTIEKIEVALCPPHGEGKSKH